MSKKVMSKKKKRNLIIIVVAVVVAVALIVVGLCLTGADSAGTVYVQSVSAVSGNKQAGGISNVYSGVTQSAKTVSVSRDSSRDIEKTYVKKGDKVTKGDRLFKYDLSQNEIEIKQANLELEKLKSELSSYNTQINQYKKQRKSAETKQEELEYTTQILNLQTSVKETQYNIESKQLEISNLQKEASSATVSAPISGVVNSINTSSAEEYITIVSTGSFAVKGVINEQNIDEISVGEKVVVRSRVDDSTIWHGTISSIDSDPVKDTEINESSQYNFYVNVVSGDSLKLGQHVYIEADYGQTSSGTVSIPEYYIVDADGSPYVWAVDSDAKIAKRSVKLGEYNKSTGCYEISSGLEVSDYIAWPSEQIKEGQSAVTADDTADTETTTAK